MQCEGFARVFAASRVILENNQPGTAFSGFNKNSVVACRSSDNCHRSRPRDRRDGARCGLQPRRLGATQRGQPSAGDRLHVFSADLTDASKRGLEECISKRG